MADNSREDLPCSIAATFEDVPVIHGDTPENGVISHRYQGFDESLLMHLP